MHVVTLSFIDEKEIDDENDCKSFLLHSCCKRKLS